MQKIIPPALQDAIEFLPAEAEEFGQVYLVGGCVRDAFLGKSSHDLDLVVLGDVRQAARVTAKALHSNACFLLDAERNTWRVIAEKDGAMVEIDFSAPRAGSLEGDLRLRDFTINAMAVGLHEPAVLIDPCGGMTDLQQKVIRVCSPSSFIDDPVRTIRAVRFAADLGFRIEPATVSLLKGSTKSLSRVSAERVRDEFFKVCTCKNPAPAIHVLENLGLLLEIFPELKGLTDLPQAYPDPLDVWQHTMGVVKGLQRLLTVLSGRFPADEAQNMLMGKAVQALGRYRQNLEQVWGERPVKDRPVLGLLYWMAILHDAGKPVVVKFDDKGHTSFPGHAGAGAAIAETACTRMKLSRAEIKRTSLAVNGHQLLHQLAEGKGDSSPLGIYRLYRQYGESMLDICILGLADTLGKFQQQPPEEYWQKELDTARLLMEAWFEKQAEWIDPPRLVDGNELMQLESLEPGSQVGDLLEQIRELQVTGEIKTRQDLLAWLEKRHGL